MNRSKCTDQSIEVYTYDRVSRNCSPAIWRGCNTGNLFTNQHNCLTTCNPGGTTPDFNENLKLLIPKEAAKIDTILDAIIQETTSSTRAYTIESSTTKAPNVEVERNSGKDSVSKENGDEEATTVKHETPTMVAMTTSTPETTMTTIATTTTPTKADTTTTIMAPTTTVTETTVEITTDAYVSGTVEEVVLPYR